jgi:hypothetical protein
MRPEEGEALTQHRSWRTNGGPLGSTLDSQLRCSIGRGPRSLRPILHSTKLAPNRRSTGSFVGLTNAR